MQKSSKTETHRSLLLSVIILGLFAALFIVPYQFKSEAVVNSQDTKGFDNITRSHDPNIPNYDIRTQKSNETHDSLMKFRGDIGKSASAKSLSLYVGRKLEDSPTLNIEFSVSIKSFSSSNFHVIPACFPLAPIVFHSKVMKSPQHGHGTKYLGKLDLLAGEADPSRPSGMVDHAT